MYQLLLYGVVFLSVISFFLALIACARVGKVLRISKELDWSDVANITGDLSTVKKTIQTLNNRINGMHSPKIQEEQLIQHLLTKQPNHGANGKCIGG